MSLFGFGKKGHSKSAEDISEENRAVISAVKDLLNQKDERIKNLELSFDHLASLVEKSLELMYQVLRLENDEDDGDDLVPSLFETTKKKLRELFSQLLEALEEAEKLKAEYNKMDTYKPEKLKAEYSKMVAAYKAEKLKAEYSKKMDAYNNKQSEPEVSCDSDKSKSLVKDMGEESEPEVSCDSDKSKSLVNDMGEEGDE